MCVNRTLYGICAAKHGRGDTENSYVFFLLGANVRGVGSASREMLPPFRLPLRRFGSCPADGTHKLLTTT